MVLYNACSWSVFAFILVKVAAITFAVRTSFIRIIVSWSVPQFVMFFLSPGLAGTPHEMDLFIVVYKRICCIAYG
nr:MAG TPA: hypothetical protein [Bacteriophage sp.]